MSKGENDPDMLQLLDEQDISWVKSWRRAANKVSRQMMSAAIVVQPNETLCAEQANI